MIGAMQKPIQSSTGQEPLRIGLFTDTYSPQINGVVTSLRGLSKGLREMGHGVTIVAPRIPGQHAEPGVIRLRSAVYPLMPEHFMALPPSPRKLLQLRTLRLDVVHTHGILVPMMALGIARAFGIPLVHTYHTRMRDYIHHYPWYPALAWLTDEERWFARNSGGLRRVSRRLRKNLDRSTIAVGGRFDVWYANRCTEVICPAQPMADELLQMGVKRPLFVIGNGIDVERLTKPSPDPFPALGVPDGAPRLLTVSRLGLEKSVDELLERFKLIHDRSPHARLVILGDGPERENLEQLAQTLGIREAVIFRGYVAPEAVSEFYQHADLFVFASTSEVHPMVGLEAAACGLPIVARARMGITKCVVDGETGFLVDPEDKALFRDRVIELLENRTKHTVFSEYSKVWAAKEWGHGRMAERTLDVYQRAMRDFDGWDELQLPPEFQKLEYRQAGE
jgi:1,2-diacylglycerol 3-alpha-glucosyltransferase